MLPTSPAGVRADGAETVGSAAGGQGDVMALTVCIVVLFSTAGRRGARPHTAGEKGGLRVVVARRARRTARPADTGPF
ncbi:hypothetical protein GCM10017688_50340 [Streptomyces ramulosus]